MLRTAIALWDNCAQLENVKSTLNASKWRLGSLFMMCVLFSVNNLTIAAVWEDLQPGDYAITAPSGTFDTGDSVEFLFEIGDPASNQEDLIAVELQLELSDYAIVPGTMIPDTAGSWVHGDGEFDHTVTHDSRLSTLDILTERPDLTSVSGHGKVFSFTLICDKENTAAADLIVDDGGIILVENVEAKTSGGGAETSGNTSWSPYTPSNSLELVQVQGLGANASYYHEFRGSKGTPPQVTGLPDGMYVLVETFKDGTMRRRKIWVK